jgi:hypothetical protein
MLKNNSKKRILENFKALDFIFFGKPIDEVETCCPFLKEDYLSTKGMFFSIIIEIYDLINHNPKSDNFNEIQNINDLIESSKKSAKVAVENSKKILNTKNGKKTLVEQINRSLKNDENQNLNDVVQEEIKRKAFSIAIDNIIIAKAIRETENYKNLNSWKGGVLEEAYKTVRDNLIETSIIIGE